MISIRLNRTSALCAAAALWLAPSGAFAQEGAQQQDQQVQVAEQCLQRLQQATVRMQEDQFWLTGWGRGYGTAQPMAGAPDMAPVDGAAGTAPLGADPLTGDPRGTAEGIHSPREQVRALYFAAQVLAHRGEEEGCDYVAGQLETIYAGYVQQLEEAGVSPASITDWRQEQLALAQPIDQVEGLHAYRIDDVTGTDVRNVQDQNLGSVHDVLIDPATGSASYILVARGGFLGIGEDYVAVPWEEVNATPGLQTIVLHLTPADMDRAPPVDPDRLRDPATTQEERGAVDQFWADIRG